MHALTKVFVFWLCLPFTIECARVAKVVTYEIRVSVTSSKLMNRPLAVVSTLSVLSRSLPKSIFLMIFEMVFEILLFSSSVDMESILSCRVFAIWKTEWMRNPSYRRG